MPLEEEEQGTSTANAWYIWPLYRFEPEAAQIPLFDDFQVWTYNEDTLNGAFGDAASEHITDYFRHTSAPSALLVKLGEAQIGVQSGHLLFGIPPMLQEDPSWFCPQPVAVLRLFKRGVFGVGPLLLVAYTSLESKELVVVSTISLGSLGSGFSTFLGQTDVFKLHIAEVPTLLKFSEKALPHLRECTRHPRLGIALRYFSESYTPKDPEYQLIDLCIALESLFLQEEMELSHKLCFRATFLLSEQEEERRNQVTELRQFYAARSKIVHGGVLRERHKEMLKRIEILREYVRHSIRSFLSLSAQYNFDSEFYERLDRLPFDSRLAKDMRLEARQLEPS